MSKENYILFIGEEYYPRGGAYDIHGYYNTIEEAKEAFKNELKLFVYPWANILCLTTRETVAHYQDGAWK